MRFKLTAPELFETLMWTRGPNKRERLKVSLTRPTMRHSIKVSSEINNWDAIYAITVLDHFSNAQLRRLSGSRRNRFRQLMQGKCRRELRSKDLKQCVAICQKC